MHNLSTFGVKTNHGQPQTHKTHHGPDLGEATTFPFPVFSITFHGATSKWHFILRLPSESLGIPIIGTFMTVTTLALGSWPRQRVARLRTKRETQESLHMLPGMQRVWGNEPSHSQVNSHVGNWSLEWSPEFSERDFKGQNPLPWRFFCIIGKLLKFRCLKWARIAHLDVCITSYGQKKGRESNWQFDSRPVKVRNRLDSLACSRHATYHWKALDKGYNFALNIITIASLHKKLCALKVVGVPTIAISGLPLESPRTKSHLDVAPVERHKIDYKGEGGGFPQVWAVVSLVCLGARGSS